MHKNFKFNLQGKTTKRKALISTKHWKNLVTKYPFVMEITPDRDIFSDAAKTTFDRSGHISTVIKDRCKF